MNTSYENNSYESPTAYDNGNGVGGDTYKIKVTTNDTTPAFTFDKFTSSDGSVTFDVLNGGADETLDIKAVGVGGGSPASPVGSLQYNLDGSNFGAFGSYSSVDNDLNLPDDLEMYVDGLEIWNAVSEGFARFKFDSLANIHDAPQEHNFRINGVQKGEIDQWGVASYEDFWLKNNDGIFQFGTSLNVSSKAIKYDHTNDNFEMLNAVKFSDYAGATPSNGLMQYNSADDDFEFYQKGLWVKLNSVGVGSNISLSNILASLWACDSAGTIWTGIGGGAGNTYFNIYSPSGTGEAGFIYYFCTQANGNRDIGGGIYDINGTLIESTVLGTPTVGFQALALNNFTTLIDGDAYYVALACNENGARFLMQSNKWNGAGDTIAGESANTFIPNSIAGVLSNKRNYRFYIGMS